MKQWMIYGATGHTGSLIAQEAIRWGLAPILAGRDSQRLKAKASELGLNYLPCSLEQLPAAPDLSHIALILNCAGPFQETAPILSRFCLDHGIHYADIGGETDSLQTLRSLHQEALQKETSLVGACGFAVLPTDCLTQLLHQQLPTATHLTIGIQYSDHPQASLFGSISRVLMGIKQHIMVGPGSVRTAIHSLRSSPVIHSHGELRSVPWASRQLRPLPFGNGSGRGILFPWADTVTAPHRWDLIQVEAYLAVQAWEALALYGVRLLQPLLASRLIQRIMSQKVRSDYTVQFPAGSSSTFWARLSDGRHHVEGTMTHTPGSLLNGYDLTVHGALAIVDFILHQNTIPSGFHTPASMAGADIWRKIPGLCVHLGNKIP